MNHSVELCRGSQGDGQQSERQGWREDAGRAEGAAQDRKGGETGRGKSEDGEGASAVKAGRMCRAADHEEPQAVINKWCSPPPARSVRAILERLLR
jgi:hypothetical protein